MILPKITIITPTFNAGESIETALLSVANQTYKNIEHIIVDGASKDKTLQIIRRYLKKYKNIRLLIEPDEGIYFAMNKGLDLCTGDWIYFMGADDTFYNENVLTDLNDQGLFQEEQIVYGNVIIKKDAPWAKDNSIYDGPFTLEKLFRWNICHQSIFYPKSVIRQVGYYETKYKVTSDWDYNVRCYAKYKFTYTDKIIAFFKTGGKSSEGGDYSLHLDFPNNVIKYFQLDIHDSNLYLATSPFYYPMARFREEENLKTIRDLREETTKLDNYIAELQRNNNESVSALKAYHERSIGETNQEHAKAVTSLRMEYTGTMEVLRNEYSDLLNTLKREHAEIVDTLKRQHAEIVNTLKNDYEQKIIALHAEFQSLQSQFIQKTKEFNDEVTTLKTQVEHLSDYILIKDHEIQEMKETHAYEIEQLRSIISDNELHIRNIFDSYTWRTGKVLLSPLIFLKRRFFRS